MIIILTGGSTIKGIFFFLWFSFLLRGHMSFAKKVFAQKIKTNEDERFQCEITAITCFFFYGGRFKLLNWQCVHSNSSVDDFISLIVPFRLFCTHWVIQEKKLLMQCTFVLLICNVWRRFYFCTHPVRHNFKCEVFLWLMYKKTKTNKPWSTNVFTSSLCCYVYFCDLLNVLGMINTAAISLPYYSWSQRVEVSGHCASLTWFLCYSFFWGAS